jgi:hypothetical protein
MPSTKYGPSVCCGVPSCSISDGVSVHGLLVDALFCDADNSGDIDGGGNVVGLGPTGEDKFGIDTEYILPVLRLGFAEVGADTNPDPSIIRTVKDN